MRKVLDHMEENIARYTILALAVLVPLSGLLGQLGADLGGVDTPAGKIALGAVSALGTVIAGLTFLNNLGKYQMLRDFGNLFDVFKNGTDPALAETVEEDTSPGDIRPESAITPVPPLEEANPTITPEP